MSYDAGSNVRKIVASRLRAVGRSPGSPLEADFQKQVIELAKLYGWTIAHFRPARTADGGWRTPVQADGKGFPDLVLVRGSELIFAELKSESGRLTREQRDWIEKLGSVPGILVRVWRPDDFEGIKEELKPLWGQRAG